jgi:hypothetical protein
MENKFKEDEIVCAKINPGFKLVSLCYIYEYQNIIKNR